MKTLPRPLVVVCAAAALGATILSACLVQRPAVLGSPAPEEAVQTIPADLLPHEKQRIRVFRNASPAVVFITNRALVRQRVGFFHYTEREVQRGSGTGFVWDDKGHIVTNAHVIAGANRLTVAFDDHTSYPAALVGVYEDKDVAVLKVDAPKEKLRPVRIGRSAELLVGQTALAIGNPFGLDQTLTVGVISALDREIRARNNRLITGVVQTDAEINPGNSGGPLLDSRGRVIGMNTAILSPSGASSGIGFAVPIDTVQSVVGQIIEGRVRRPGLGVTLWPEHMVRGLIARTFGVPGLLIYAAPEGSAAAGAGLRPTVLYTNGDRELGDLIVGINGERISNSIELQDALDRFEIGAEIELHFIRDRREQKTKLKLQEIEVEVK